MGSLLPPEKPTVYVIDDDASVCRALERLLRSANYCAVTFGSAEEFLKFDHSLSESCLVLDIRLPGMDGLELQEVLVAKGASNSVVFMTAHENPNWRERAFKAGAVAYLKKPFREEALLKAIEQSFKKAGFFTPLKGDPYSGAFQKGE